MLNNMLKKKKGAIELSMTTIIVIVMGVTLLILGITFVRTIFTKVGGISKETFARADTLLQGLENVNEFLTITPSIAEIEQTKDSVSIITILNLQGDSIKISAEVTPADKGIECIFGDTSKTTSDSYTISSGKTKSLKLFIKDLKGNIRTTACNVEIIGAPEGEDNAETIPIRIVKEVSTF